MSATEGYNPSLNYGAVICDFKVTPSVCKSRSFDASWVVEPAPGSVNFTPRFMLQIAETEAGEWKNVFAQPVTVTSIEGVGHKLYSHRPGRFLRLVVKDPSGKNLVVSDPMDPTHTLTRRDYLEYREQIRLENLALNKLTGFNGFLVKKVITECPCPECSDEILGGAPDSNCNVCFGTGIVQGYHCPVPMKADWSSTPKGRGKQKESKMGITEVEVKRIKTLPFPSAAFKDIWIDAASNQRYVVSNPEPVVFKIFPIAQLLTISLLPKTDPAYKIPLPE